MIWRKAAPRSFGVTTHFPISAPGGDYGGEQNREGKKRKEETHWERKTREKQQRQRLGGRQKFNSKSLRLC